MTRTRTGEYKGLAATQRDRHQSRNGADPRAIPKKAGAGNGNWGVPGCELDQQEQNAVGTTATSPPENRITVIDAETFSRLQNSGSSNDAQAMVNDDNYRDADTNATSNGGAASSTSASSS